MGFLLFRLKKNYVNQLNLTDYGKKAVQNPVKTLKTLDFSGF